MKNKKTAKPTFVNSVKRPVDVKGKEVAEDIAIITAMDITTILH